MFEWMVVATVGYAVYRIIKGNGSESNTAVIPPPKPEVVLPAEKLITLIGSAGVGKSSTGNALLGIDAFETDVTYGTTVQTSERDYRNGYKIVDTPGLLDDRKFYDVVWGAIRRSEIVIFVTDRQMFRQEMEILAEVARKLEVWNKSSVDGSRRKLILYVNRQDVKAQTMTSSDREAQIQAIKSQVAGLIDDIDIAVGSARPIYNGLHHPPEINELTSLIQRHI